MEMCIWVSINKDKNTATAACRQKMKKVFLCYTQVILKMIKYKAKANCSKPMELATQEAGSKIKNTELELTTGLMDVYMKANFSIIKDMDMVNLLYQMEEYTTVAG